MPRSSKPLDAYPAPPVVIRHGDEILIRSPHEEACYTLDAARALVIRLQTVLESSREMEA